MSGRYSIDYPGSDGETEGDLVFDSGYPRLSTDELDLLNQDEEAERILEAGRVKPQSSLVSGGKKALKSLRKVSWGPTYSQLDNGASTPKSHRLETFGFSHGGQDASEDDSEFDSDIEVDLETRPRRRVKASGFGRSLHSLMVLSLFLFVIFLFARGLLYLSSVVHHTRPRGTLHKRLLSNGTHQFHPTTLVISLDGMHPHYVSKDLTPNMHRLFREEASAPYMIPSFPSSTFPNHWTLLTGLYPANHGIVGNTFWDPKLEKQFVNVKPEFSLSPQWWGGEPIWKTANYDKVKTAVHMWPGSEVKWSAAVDKPMYVDKFNMSELLPLKAKRVFEWIDTPDLESRPELLLTYVPNVDAWGHQYGIYGPEIREVLTHADDLIGLLLDGLKQRNLEDVVNFIVLSDHGMAPTNNSRIVYLEDLVNLGDYAHIDGSPLVGLRPKSDFTRSVQDVYAELKQKEPSNGAWQVYLDSNMPKEWNFGGINSKYQSRIAPLWIVPGVGYVVTTRDKLEEMGGTYHPFGVHGYNNTETLMRALFLAQGPYFGKSLRYAPFPNVDIYNILCDTLDVIPAPNDGSKRTLRPLPANWIDTQAYPNVEFHTEILKVNSTYDELFDDEHTEGYQPHAHSNSTISVPDSDPKEDNSDENNTWGDRLKQGIDSVKDWFTDIFGDHKSGDDDE